MIRVVPIALAAVLGIAPAVALACDPSTANGLAACPGIGGP